MTNFKEHGVQLAIKRVEAQYRIENSQGHLIVMLRKFLARLS